MYSDWFFYTTLTKLDLNLPLLFPQIQKCGWQNDLHDIYTANL